MKLKIVLLVLTLTFISANVYNSDPEIAPDKSRFIRIWHDESGMPHVVADDLYGVYYGYGYCLGRDRMFQLEVLRRSSAGTLSEVFGPEYIEVDFMARRDRVDPTEIVTGLEHSPAAFRQALTAFTNGINRAIADACAGRLKLEPAFAKAGITPEPFTLLQIVDIFAGTMAARYNDFTMELDNLHLLNSLVRKYGARAASEIFEDVVFYEDPEIYTTLGDMPFFKPGFRFSPKTSPASSFTAPTHSPTLQTQKRNRLLKALGVPDKSGSYGAALSLVPRGEKKALLYGGPQMGYFKPSAVYGIGLHTPDFDLVGTTPVGYIALMFATNRNMAFTSTAGVGNLVDLVYLKADPDDPNVLSGPGQSLQMNRRTEEIKVKGQPKPVLREVINTDLGPVMAVEGDTYYVKQRAWKGRVVESYAAWFDSTFCDNLQDWLTASDRNSLSINWLAADREGNIAFVHCGLGKSRRSFGDDRLPVNQPTSFVSPEKRLAAMNPASGFYANWNCPPVKGYRNGDLQTNWAADQRSRYLADHLAINRQNWSLEYLEQLDRDIAFTDQRAWFFRDQLLSLVDENLLSPLAKEAFVRVRDWNELLTDQNGDGYYDDSSAGIFDLFFNALYGKTLAEKLGDFAWMSGSDSTWTQSNLLKKALFGQSWHDYLAARDARDFVTEIFEDTVKSAVGASDRLPDFPVKTMEFAPVNHVGAPTMNSVASCTPFMNRGSDIQLVELSSSGIKILGCTPPGNTATGEVAESQMRDFKNFKFSPRALYLKDVKALRGRYMVIRAE